MSQVLVVKIGGSTLGQHDTTLYDLVEIQKRGMKVVVVHGGGKIITDWLAKQGASTQFINGERVTDKSGLEIATAVLCGLVNKDLVANLIKLGGKAIGLSGVDGALIRGKIRVKELGYVGAVEQIDTTLLRLILENDYIPVISSISFNPHQDPALASALLNINADSAAGDIAASLGASKLVFLTDVAGICDKSGKVMSSLTTVEAEAAIASGVASGGMIPKIRAGIRALEGAGEARIIDGRQPHALLNEIENSRGGTTISTVIK